MTDAVFIYGQHEYDYTLLKQERKTLSLTVDPSMRIIVKAPVGVDKARIETFLKKKWMWLEKQLAFFDKYQRKTYAREYVSGESFLYLGRQYKLVVRRGMTDKVVISNRELSVTTTRLVADSVHNKKLVEKWFAKRRDVVFRKRFEKVFDHFDYAHMPELEVRSMPKRWGSLLKDKKVLLNPLLIQAPKEAIDYVITHELCHIRYSKHDKNFYEFLESKIPDWRTVKEKLELKVN